MPQSHTVDRNVKNLTEFDNKIQVNVNQVGQILALNTYDVSIDLTAFKDFTKEFLRTLW